MILDEVEAHLASNGVSSPIFKALMPDAPDDALCLYEYAGGPPRFAHDGQAWENLRVQVVSRATSYPAARAAAQNVYDALNGLSNRAIGGHDYLWAGALQSPFSLGRDDNSRHRIIINFELLRK